jgi:hypothetical protein
MLYIFCDEDIQPVGVAWHYNFSAVAFYQDRFNSSGVNSVRNLRQGGKSLLPQIEQALRNNEGMALISHTVVPADLLPKGAKIKFDDTVKVARKDVVWSQCMIATIAKLDLRLIKRSWAFKTIDIFYDSKSLTPQYRDLIEQYLRNNLTQRLKRFVARSNKNLGKKINIRIIKAVAKPQSGSPPDKFQLGVWLADRIVRRYEEVASKKAGGSIITEDITNDVNEVLIELFELCE